MAYVVSFMTIGIIWANHHTVMNQIARADRTFLMLTVAFLLVVAFIPFPTRLVQVYISDPANAAAATVAYGITLTLTAVMFNALWFYAVRGGRLLRADADERTVQGISKTFRLGPWIYLAVTLVAVKAPKVGRRRVPPLRLVLGDRELGLRPKQRRSIGDLDWFGRYL